MGKVKQPWHKGTHQARAKRITDAANANPGHTCWRCGRTLTQVRRTNPKARWTAGHVNTSEIGGELRAECSPCNYGHGAAYGNRLRSRRPVLRPLPQLRTSRSW